MSYNISTNGEELRAFAKRSFVEFNNFLFAIFFLPFPRFIGTANCKIHSVIATIFRSESFATVNVIN